MEEFHGRIHKAGIDASRVEVRVFDRCVTVKGVVDAVWKKTRIEGLISGVFGVIDVNNALTVVPDTDIADRQITADIIEALRRNRYVPTGSISVKVENGRVVLSGRLPDMISYQSTCQSALITRGVRAVVHPILIERPGDR
jgi:osmotically-inducible protein OsmY